MDKPPFPARDFFGVQPMLEEIARCGTEAGGGVTRLLYTEAWTSVQSFLAGRMQELGLEVRFDRAGNLYGRLPGRDAGAPVILTGSHIDTVRAGGKYDGAYGVAAGMLALAHLRRVCGKPRTTLEVVSLCEEEGGRFPLTFWGSGNIIGRYGLQCGEQVRDEDGITLSDAMREAGFGKADQPHCRRTDIGAFVELHIEQGITLERMGKRIGLVEAIVGQRRYGVVLKGRQNHAGTTPMAMRADPLAGAAKMMVGLEARALRYGEPLVATVGRLELFPNVSNVIPGEARFTLDIRHDDERKLAQFCDETRADFETIAKRRGLELDLQPWLHTEPVAMNPAFVDELERICREERFSCRRMVSGAGHDAQLFASVCPTAMLFVPSRGGISHSPDEFTPEDCLAEGAAVLASFLLQLAYYII